MKGTLPAAGQAQTLNAALAKLSQCLDMDAGTLIPELRQAEEDRHRNAPAAAGTEEQTATVLHEEVMEDDEEAPQHRRNGKAARIDNDFSDLLPVSGHLSKMQCEPSEPSEPCFIVSRILWFYL